MMTLTARLAAGIVIEPAGVSRGASRRHRRRQAPRETLARRAARARAAAPRGAATRRRRRRRRRRRGDRRGHGVVSGDDLAALLYLATSHPDDFIRCACAARALELRDLPVTAASVARTAQVDDRALAGDVADRLGVAQPARLYDLRLYVRLEFARRRRHRVRARAAHGHVGDHDRAPLRHARRGRRPGHCAASERVRDRPGAGGRRRRLTVWARIGPARRER